MEAAGRERLIEFFTKADSFASLEEAALAITEYLPVRKNVRPENLARSLRQTPDGRWVWKHGLGRRQRLTDQQAPHIGTAIDPILEGLDDDARTLTCPTLILRGAKSDLLTRRPPSNSPVPCNERRWPPSAPPATWPSATTRRPPFR